MNDQSEAPRLWARKGETVCCINGHEICHAAHDIYVGDLWSPGNFDGWHQPEPERAASLADIRCTECRAIWIRPNGQLHFAEGWR